jgi:hypothetical protein
VIGPAIETYGYGWGVLTWGFSTWGTGRAASDVSLEAGSWSLDNYGQKLIATIQAGKTFEWDPIAVSGTALQTRATVLTGAPTTSHMTIVSDRDRHLFHMGTETTIGIHLLIIECLFVFPIKKIQKYTPYCNQYCRNVSIRCG